MQTAGAVGVRNGLRIGHQNEGEFTGQFGESSVGRYEKRTFPIWKFWVTQLPAVYDGD